MKKEC